MSVLDRARAIRLAAQQSYGLAKQAFVPFTPAAQEAAMNPQMAGAPMPAAGGMPMGPANPGAAAGGMPPMPTDMSGGVLMPQGGMPQGSGGMQIQMVPGPNGEPIDAETGMIVLDPQQGIEVDPNTGISLNRSTGEFVGPDGQPLPPEQAMQLIAQAAQPAAPMQGGMPQGGGMPPMDMMNAGQSVMQQTPMPDAAGGAVPMQQMAADDPMANPADMLGAPIAAGAQPPMPAGQVDPAIGMMVDPNTGMPIDPATGNLIDPTTGQMVSPTTGQPAAPVSTADGQDSEANDELAELLKDTDRALETQDKNMHRVTQEVAGMRADIQGLRRQIQQESDDKETLLARIDNLVNIAETVLNGRPGVQPIAADPASAQ
jgi:hypothetical protein